MEKRTVLLVAGAWTGTWVWRDVAKRLRARGYDVFSVTLTGIADRRNEFSPDIGLGTHIRDLITYVEMEDLRDLILVGWSYGGMVITGAAQALADRVVRLVYLDAYVPEDGKAVIDYLPPEGRAAHEASASRNEPVYPIPLEAFGIVDPKMHDLITPRLTDQPWRTFLEPVCLTGMTDRIPKSYVFCAGPSSWLFQSTYERMLSNPEVQTQIIEADHFCMLSAPEITAESLVRAML